MTAREQQQALERDLNAVIARYRAEFELTVADAVGVIECVKMALYLGECDEAE